MSTQWYTGIVLHGDQTGRTIGFPTINLNPNQLIEDKIEPGIYASLVRIDEKTYKGVLYLGPRLVKGEQHTVLEIHILDFTQDVYQEHIEFSLQGFIRPPRDFDSLEELQKEISLDIEKATMLLRSS